jgi:hypothetical protein
MLDDDLEDWARNGFDAMRRAVAQWNAANRDDSMEFTPGRANKLQPERLEKGLRQVPLESTGDVASRAQHGSLVCDHTDFELWVVPEDGEPDHVIIRKWLAEPVTFHFSAAEAFEVFSSFCVRFTSFVWPDQYGTGFSVFELRVSIPFAGLSGSVLRETVGRILLSEERFLDTKDRWSEWGNDR